MLEETEGLFVYDLGTFCRISEIINCNVSFKVKKVKVPWGRDEIPGEVMEIIGFDCLASGCNFKLKKKGAAEYKVDVTCS